MLTIQGRLLKVLPKQEGIGASGRWVNLSFVIEYGNDRPIYAAFSIFGEEMIQRFRWISPGMDVQVGFYPESREYNGKWYTNLKCVRISKAKNTAGQTPANLQPKAKEIQPEQEYMPQGEDEELPF